MPSQSLRLVPSFFHETGRSRGRFCSERVADNRWGNLILEQLDAKVYLCHQNS